MSDERTNAPNLFVIGAGKSGTTALHNFLNQHPDISMSINKEPSFFSMDSQFNKGIDWYLKNFRGGDGETYRGEASNSYSALGLYPKTIERIAQHIERPKFIYSVRHPVRRTESDWMEAQKYKRIDFSTFLRSDSAYYDKNLYLRTFNAYREAFGEQSVCVVFYEELAEHPSACLKKIFSFLDLHDSYEIESETKHRPSAEAEVFSTATRRFIDSELYSRYVVFWLSPQFKKTMRSMLTRRKTISRPRWTDYDFSWFKDEFKNETDDFLTKMGMQTNFWNWDMPD